VFYFYSIPFHLSNLLTNGAQKAAVKADKQAADEAKAAEAEASTWKQGARGGNAKK
jgi:hypothetical protein